MKSKKLKKSKKRNARSIYKDKTWKMFALYIKLRDSDANCDCQCCTCSVVKKFYNPEGHAGHFVTGRTNRVLFDEKLVHFQCQECNYGTRTTPKGNQAKYAIFMKNKYNLNDEDILEMLNLNKEILQYKESDFLFLIKYYYKKIIELKESKFCFNEFAQSKIDEKLKSISIKRIINE